MADQTAEQPTHKVTADGTVLVALALAHPYPKEYAERVRAEDIRDYAVGETIYVTREFGNAMIDAGMVQVDPIDADARRAALLLNRRNQPLTVKEIEAKEARAAGADDDDGDAARGAAAEKPQSAADTKSAAKK